ncbi:hypothetical protein [Halalkalibacter hemicellulosilyticus]|uniref:hypothetical protein n=1 Tax=Halalkalibacter hemicellulosilyticus TaxID=127886 RepID=UPI00068C457B|nr:hypothetical protein [Halalkalibacter hemicellulosilyticus]
MKGTGRVIFYISLYVIFFTFLLFVVGLTSYKMIKTKTIPDNNFTPFDYIMAQSPVELHEEKEVREEEDEQGDGNVRL